MLSFSTATLSMAGRAVLANPINPSPTPNIPKWKRRKTDCQKVCTNLYDKLLQQRK